MVSLSHCCGSSLSPSHSMPLPVTQEQRKQSMIQLFHRGGIKDGGRWKQGWRRRRMTLHSSDGEQTSLSSSRLHQPAHHHLASRLSPAQTSAVPHTPILPPAATVHASPPSPHCRVCLRVEVVHSHPPTPPHTRRAIYLGLSSLHHHRSILHCLHIRVVFTHSIPTWN